MSTWPWPAPVDDGAAAHLVPGLAMPQVALTATTGGPVTLSEQSGRTVVFCYPWTGGPGLTNPPGWDDVPGAHGSTPEAEGFRNLHAAFAGLRIPVFGLSTQSPKHQTDLALRLKLPYRLLSDEEFRFQSTLTLPTFEAGGVRYLKRLTIVLCDGVIERVFYPVHPPHTHPRAVVAWCSASTSYAEVVAAKVAG
jgi:peroxiredoxin